MKRRIISLLMALVMTLSLVPTAAWAEATASGQAAIPVVSNGAQKDDDSVTIGEQNTNTSGGGVYDDGTGGTGTGGGVYEAPAETPASSQPVTIIFPGGLSNSYNSLAEAFAVANQSSGYTVRLNEDVEINNSDGSGIDVSSNVTLDLNGKKVKQGAKYFYGYSTSSLFDTSGTGTLTICDSVGGGEIEQTLNYPAVTASKNGTVIIRLSAGDIQTIVGGKQHYRALIHKRIPIHAIGIEILPAYYENFLKKQYPDIYFDLPSAFQSVDQATDFPAMSKLLFEIENYRGDGMAAALFYEAKVTEAIALVVDAWKRQSQSQARPLSAEDAKSLQNVVSYIADHYAFDIPLERLANIACMSESKLKGCFKRQFGCSVTQYIQGRRMSQAEHLLINTDFTMGQIAQMIGYTTSSRFAELFKKSTGILPIEYRKIARCE